MSDELAARVHALIAQWREGADGVEREIQPGGIRERYPEGPRYGISAVRACADELEAALAAAQPEQCVCGDEDGMAVYSVDCPNELHANRARKAAALAAALAPTSEKDSAMTDPVEELLGGLDVLYRYASDDGCPHAEHHRFARPNRARLVIETWLTAHPAAAPPDPTKPRLFDERRHDGGH